MVKKNIKINWENQAKLQLKKVCAYIRKDSPKNSEKVREDILNAVSLISPYPEKYPADKYKTNNDGSFRAFELHHLRVVYHILPAEIKIISVRHTKMQPMEY